MTQQEKDDTVKKVMGNVQKVEINNNKIDLDFDIKDTLKAKGKLADKKIIDLKNIHNVSFLIQIFVSLNFYILQSFFKFLFLYASFNLIK